MRGNAGRVDLRMKIRLNRVFCRVNKIVPRKVWGRMRPSLMMLDTEVVKEAVRNAL